VTVSTLAANILAELAGRGQTLASAESVTGGMIGALLTGVPGASESYLGGVISYATRLKATLAGVTASTLTELGPVAAGTAVEMARGVAERCSADWGLATTGVAGPDTQNGHPVGQVFVAVSHQSSDLLSVRELLLQGDRARIRELSAVAALGLLAEALGLKSGASGVDDPLVT
jgi:nicotinamide-nucleotide amidase